MARVFKNYIYLLCICNFKPWRDQHIYVLVALSVCNHLLCVSMVAWKFCAEGLWMTPQGFSVLTPQFNEVNRDICICRWIKKNDTYLKMGSGFCYFRITLYEVYLLPIKLYKKYMFTLLKRWYLLMLRNLVNKGFGFR